jgi:glycine cleavage system aminomethyltransferase T
MIAAGMGAFDSLRLEKGYRLWGGDIYTEYNAYQAGLGSLTSDDPQAIALGDEPIIADKQCLGHVTSVNYGYSIGKLIAYGYLPIAYATAGTTVEIEYLGRRFTDQPTNQETISCPLKNQIVT